MPYIQFSATVFPKQPATDILIAELAEVGFESFEETSDGLLAWVQPGEFDKEAFGKIFLFHDSAYAIGYNLKEIPDRNWNELWESNFTPIELNPQAVIKAVFHKTREYDYEFLISPKMAFGTGHHETTWLMANELFKIDLQDKTVLDMGCGTGILAIIARKLGGKSAVAIDIEEPAIDNTYDHLELNNTDGVEVRLGGEEQLRENENFDIILANINRNVLTRDMSSYEKVLSAGGIILFSGFFATDVEIITATATKLGLSSVSVNTKNNWAQLTFRKP